jgi:predicted ATPase
MIKGLAKAHLGDEEGVTVFREGIALYRSTGAKWGLPFWLWHFAGVPGQRDEVRREALAEAFVAREDTGERWMEAELYRLRGDLARSGASVDNSAAESDYLLAKLIAAEQGAKLQELHAAMSLAHLWCEDGRRDKARDLLAPVYDWFTEGFDTLDLKEAKTLLSELSS